MKVLLIGAGAVGAYYASKIPNDHSVSVICRSNYAAVKEQGFTIQSNNNRSHFMPLAVFSSIDEADQHYDLVIVATKADQFIDLSRIMDANTIILIIQNGLGVEDKYEKRWPNNCILSGVTVISCAQTSPGVITHYSWTRIHIGPFKTIVSDKVGMEKADLIVNMFKSGGIQDAILCDHQELQMVRWHKLAINAAFSPTAVLSDGNFKH
jgi:2-dehydropantoate 2-reductase